jgi:hypothetical protein
MATFKDRLIEERNQLFEKVTKLEDFLQSETFKSIDVRQKHRCSAGKSLGNSASYDESIFANSDLAAFVTLN